MIEYNINVPDKDEIILFVAVPLHVLPLKAAALCVTSH